jgi:IclR family transcriptional regulator, KDG regulon repressor
MATKPAGKAPSRANGRVLAVSEPADKAPSPAVDRALTILETLVKSREPMTLTSLATKAGIPLATCASIMQTLEQRGYTSRRIVGRSHFWRPTLKLNGLSAELMRGVDLGQLVQPFLHQLVEDSQMAAHVGVLEGNMVVYAAKVPAPGMVQFNTYPGKTVQFNITALGMAIAAYLPEDQLSPLLTNMQPGPGPRARKVSVATMHAELRKVRQRGFAIEAEEEEAGIGCIAAPFFDAGGRVLGSVGVTGFVDQVKGARLRTNADAVLRAARDLAQELDPVPDHA